MSKKKNQRGSAEVPQRELPAWLALGVLAAAVWLVYGRSLDAPWIFDDSHSVLENRSITSLWPPVGDAEHPGPLYPAVEQPTTARPLVNLSLAVNYHFGRLDPWGYRAVNVLLHLFNAMLLWAIVWRTLRLPYFGGLFERSAKWLALGVSLLWALHPLVTEAVVYVTQRTELMVAFFYLGTLYASLRYWTSESNVARRGWLVVATLACLAGGASKEVIVSAPLVVLLFDWTFVSGSLREVWRRSWSLYLGLASSWLVIASLQMITPRDSAGFGLGVSLFPWWCTQARFFLMYLQLVVWPAPLVLHYDFPVESFGANWVYVLGTLVFAVVAIVLVWRRSAAGYLMASVALILAPTHLLPIVTEMAAERRMYLPLSALVVLAVVGVYLLVQRVSVNSEARWPMAVAVSLALVLGVVYGTASANRVAKFQNPLVLWQENVKLQPWNYVAQANLANSLNVTGRRAEAIEHYREAVRSKPEFAEGRYQLGLALAAAGRLDESIAELEEVVRQQPEAYKIRNNLGVVLFTGGRLREAIAEFKKTLEIRPDFAEAQENLNRARRSSVLPQRAE